MKTSIFFNNKLRFEKIEVLLILSLFLLMFFFIQVVPESFYPDHEALKKRFLEASPSKEISYTPQSLIIYIINLIKDFFCSIDLFQSNNISGSEIKKDICSKKFQISDLKRSYYIFITFIFILVLYIYKKIITSKNLISSYFVLLSLIMPSTLLSITALSAESIYTIISIITISIINFDRIVSKKNLYAIPLLIYAYFLDSGNLYVFIAFIFFSFYMFKLKLLFKNKFFLVVILSTIIIFIFSKDLFLFFGNIIDQAKTITLINNIKQLNLFTLDFANYILRFFYLVLTLLNLYLPHNYIISISSLLTWVFIFVFIICKLHKVNFFSKKNNEILILTILSFILIIIYVLPTHAFAKYYLFMLFLIIKLLKDLLGLKKIIFILPILSLISICEIALFDGLYLKNFYV